MKEEEKRILESIAPLAESRGYEVASINLASGKEKTLSIVLDRPEPISMEDIVSMSNLISDKLDEDDPIDGAYTLDVSSLGAEKPIALDKLDSYLGRYVNLHLSRPYKGENVLEGTLEAIDGETITLAYREKTKTIRATFPRIDVDKARLAIQF